MASAMCLLISMQDERVLEQLMPSVICIHIDKLVDDCGTHAFSS